MTLQRANVYSVFWENGKPCPLIYNFYRIKIGAVTFDFRTQCLEIQKIIEFREL